MRKRAQAALWVLATVVGLSSANAADIQRAPITRAPPRAIAPVFNWTGPYIGINGGGGWGRSSFSAPFASDNFRTSGGLVGGTLGYNLQIGQAVWGLEGDIDWSSIRGSGTCGAVIGCETRNNWLSTARGRLGYAADRFMPYVTGGLAVGDIRTSVNGFGSSTSTKAGWTLGGGVEATLGGPWSAKLEYLYVDLGRGGSILGSDASFRSNVVRAGINYKF